MEIVEAPTLNELLVKTSYFVQVNEPNDTALLQEPKGYGSGFIIYYKGHRFFVTADHVAHWDDYQVKSRIGIDDIVSVHTNVIDKSNLTALVAPISGIYYMEGYDITKPDGTPDLIDVCAALLKEDQTNFVTQEITLPEKCIKNGELKWMIGEEHFAQPKDEDLYYIFGSIKPNCSGVWIRYVPTMKIDLRFVSKAGDYYLLNTNDTIIQLDEWSGLSGSPVFNQNGSCIGVLCSVTENSKSVWVMSIDKVKLLLDVICMEEKLI